MFLKMLLLLSIFAGAGDRHYPLPPYGEKGKLVALTLITLLEDDIERSGFASGLGIGPLTGKSVGANLCLGRGYWCPQDIDMGSAICAISGVKCPPHPPPAQAICSAHGKKCPESISLGNAICTSKDLICPKNITVAYALCRATGTPCSPDVELPYALCNMGWFNCFFTDNLPTSICKMMGNNSNCSWIEASYLLGILARNFK